MYTLMYTLKINARAAQSRRIRRRRSRTSDDVLHAHAQVVLVVVWVVVVVVLVWFDVRRLACVAVGHGRHRGARVKNAI